MALYDKASLVLIPSGTKAGTVFSQKPVPRELSSELITNGGFDTDSDWGKNNGITISDGKSNFSGLSGQYLSQEINISSGKIYRINFTVLSGSGVLTIFLGASNNIYSKSDYNIGQNTIYAVAGGLDSKVYFGSLFTGSLDNISVKEVDIEPADFDFTRSTYATRVNSQGLIEKERSNLLLQSNTFDTTPTWTVLGAPTPTGGQTGYDGSSDAWKFTETATFTEHQLKQNLILSGVHTLSIYAKAGERDFLFFRMNLSGSWTNAVFNLSTGVVASTGGFISANMSDEGNGWYKCSAAFTNHTGSTIQFQIGETASNFYYTGIDGYGIYIQDAQLEQGLVATDYIETTTSAVYTGITDNVPRLDYDGDCPSLLLEPQRSNLIDSAEYYNGSSWSRVRSTITDNAETSPEGVDNASALIATAVNDDHYIYATPATTNAIHTYSVFLKKGNRTWARLWETTTNVFVDFNLDTGATGTTNGTIIDKGTEDFGNGWYRCYFTYDTGSAGLKVCRIYSLEGDNDRSYLGDGTTEEIYIYGAQLEEGSYATSYIPTYGTSVTRNLERPNYLDVTNLTGNAFTIFLDYKDAIRGGLTGNWMYLFNTNNQLLTYVYGGTLMLHSTSGENYTSFTFGDGKVAFVYDGTNVKYFLNGTLVKTVTASTRWDLGAEKYWLYNPFNNSESTIKYNSFIILPEALTDQECIDLTT